MNDQELLIKYKELLIEYAALEEVNTTLAKKNAALKEEIEMLRHQLPGRDPQSVKADAVNKYSSSEEKIKLFRSLFRGRDDVFARRWESVATGKNGYQPACENEWDQKLCNKKAYRCADCPNRALMQLTDEHVFRHLAGKDPYARDVVGLYPMLEDETCFFLCADFDEADYEKDAIAFLHGCETYQIPAHIERSRSGKGAHVWIFFEEAIPAYLARKMGAGILTFAMRSRSELSFRSYDRFFPNQDVMPKGGFGNLIALPLQGKARKRGNSQFVNESFVPYEDQWEYLSQVRRLSKQAVETLVTKLCKGGELGVLMEDSTEKPWDVTRAYKESVLSQFDFSQPLFIVRANMLYIPKKGVSPQALNRIKRLAAFKNPDFYRAQALRLPIYDKPRIICTADQHEDYLAIPRGCETAIRALLEEGGVSFQIEDQTFCGEPISVTFEGTLREEQERALNALLQHDTGVLSATTAFGKTVIAARLIAERKVNTLVLVHTQALMNQWKESLEHFLAFDVKEPEHPKGRGRKKIWSPVGLMGGGKDSLHGMVDVAIVQSMISDGEAKDLIRNYGMVIVDECHHISAVNFERVLKHATAKYVYGLTATPVRQDGHHPIIFMQCGPIRYVVDAKAQAQKRKFEHFIIPRFTKFRLREEEAEYASIISQLAEDEDRNAMIIEDVKQTLKDGRNPILLTERREHAFHLAELLEISLKVDDQDHNQNQFKNMNIFTLTGAASPKEKRELTQTLADVPADEPMIVVATGKYVGEGFDCPRLDTMFLALPFSWKGTVTQYAGRLHREYPGKQEVQIYDYIDIHVPNIGKMYQKRIRGYAAVGYRVKGEGSNGTQEDIFYNGKNYVPVFLEDIRTAKKELLIVSPYIHMGRLKQMEEELKVAVEQGVKVTVMTLLSVSESTSGLNSNTNLNDPITRFLDSLGVQVTAQENLYQRFAIIDGKVVWYGSVNLLAYSREEQNLMRLTDKVVARELAEAAKV